MPHDIKYYQEFGGEKVIFEKEETTEIKRLSEKGKCIISWIVLEDLLLLLREGRVLVSPQLLPQIIIYIPCHILRLDMMVCPVVKQYWYKGCFVTKQ